MDRERFPMIKDFGPEERPKIQHLVRHALENKICEKGVAFRFGNSWRIDREKLPGFLAELTQQLLEREAKLLKKLERPKARADSPPIRTKKRQDEPPVETVPDLEKRGA